MQRQGKLFEELLDKEPDILELIITGQTVGKNGDEEEAIKVYEKGMEEAKKAGDNHAYGELRGSI